MNPVIFPPLADDDLLAAWLHIASDNPTAADDYPDRIHLVCALIADNTAMGIARDEIRDGVRSFAVENHVIFYVPIGQGIVVLRVWPAAQDPARFML